MLILCELKLSQNTDHIFKLRYFNDFDYTLNSFFLVKYTFGRKKYKLKNMFNQNQGFKIVCHLKDF